jgi:hypothetical protein
MHFKKFGEDGIEKSVVALNQKHLAQMSRLFVSSAISMSLCALRQFVCMMQVGLIGRCAHGDTGAVLVNVSHSANILWTSSSQIGIITLQRTSRYGEFAAMLQRRQVLVLQSFFAGLCLEGT